MAFLHHVDFLGVNAASQQPQTQLHFWQVCILPDSCDWFQGFKEHDVIDLDCI